MKIEANTPDEYINKLPDDRKQVMNKLRKTILNNLPKGFEETLSYGTIGYVVPHSIYPNGYHCDPKLPLPFMNIASQKNFISVYHMGLYANQKLMNWFVQEYPKHSNTKLDMGKSCLRFKKMDQIPFELIAELSKKVSVKEWIEIYEEIKKSK
ncbi:MAG: DUF1801 domain-containing protein [Gelidibacter sp.]|nr:DUF1801 domain-containing protein [Gelidibacter sp.]